MIRITRTKFLSAAGLLALLYVLVCPTVRADDLTITLDTPIVGTAGQTITVFGDITNNTSSTIDFDSDSVTFNDPSTLSGNPDVVFNAILGVGPASVDPGSLLTDVDLFTLIIAPSAAPGVYDLNYYDLMGVNGSSGTLGFSVTVPAITPEPGSLTLLASGLLLGLVVLRRAGR